MICLNVSMHVSHHYDYGYIEPSPTFQPIIDGKIPLPTARRIFAQIVLAVEYMDAHNIVHRDLKDEVNGFQCEAVSLN